MCTYRLCALSGGLRSPSLASRLGALNHLILSISLEHSVLTSEGLGERAQVIPEDKRESIRLIWGGGLHSDSQALNEKTSCPTLWPMVRAPDHFVWP